MLYNSMSLRAEGEAISSLQEIASSQQTLLAMTYPNFMSTHQIQYGTQTIDYKLEFMPRKTMSISVHPDLSVIVKVPADTSLEEVNKRVVKRAKWILNQKRRFEIFLPDVPPRKYVSGESHRFLGRQYRLKVIKNDTEQINSPANFSKFTRQTQILPVFEN